MKCTLKQVLGYRQVVLWGVCVEAITAIAMGQPVCLLPSFGATSLLANEHAAWQAQQVTPATFTRVRPQFKPGIVLSGSYHLSRIIGRRRAE